MFIHGSSCLQGPISRKRGWWSSNSDEIDVQNARVEVRPTADAPIRTELVKRVRQEIAAGTYDTAEKLEIALNRLFDRLGS
jgi:hypothetical protein